MALSGVLTDIPRRAQELGRIRLGEKTPAGLPVKLKTFRLTSHSRQLLEVAASLYGGTVRDWKGAPDDGMYELVTETAELDILIPGANDAITQSHELWSGGTCSRRCDGTTDRVNPKEPRPCVCTMLGQVGAEQDCEILTRLNVILPRVPGLGTWLLTTSGWYAATTLPQTLDMVAQLSGQSDGGRALWFPAVLRADQRSTKTRDPKTNKVTTNRFVVPVIEMPGLRIADLVESAGLLPAAAVTPALPSGAAARAAAARAQIEARSTTSDAAPVPAEERPAPVAEPDRTAGGAAGAKPAQCDGFSVDLGRCRKEAGHDGGHRNPDGAWPR